MKRFLMLSLMVVILGISVSWAGPVIPAQIGAEAVWFGQVDLEAVRAMPLAQLCSLLSGQNPKWAKKMADIQEKIGCNPMQDLLDITMYATQYEGDYGVVIVHVRNFDRQKLMAWFKERRPEHTTEAFGDLTLYTWTLRHRGRELELTGAIAADDLVIIGADSKHVKAALEVIQGRKPGLKEDSPLIRGWEPGTLWMSQAVAVPAEYRKTTMCPVLKQANAAFARWWSKDDLLFGRYTIQTISPETAGLFLQAANGLKAIFLLRFSGNEPLVKLLEGLSYRVGDNVFTLSWHGRMVDLLTAGKALHEVCGHWGKPRHAKP